jgi:ATP-dependent DNA ligase
LQSRGRPKYSHVSLRIGVGLKGIWVEPQLLAEIEYRAKSAEGKVRHPFFKGLREDLQ